MVAWWWSWLLTAMGILGLWLAGSNNKKGWMIGLFAQILWISYALVSKQYGFLASAFAYGTVYFRNFKRWKLKED